MKSVQIRSYFWSIFSCIWTEYFINLRIQFKYKKIRTRNNSVFRHLSSRSDFWGNKDWVYRNWTRETLICEPILGQCFLLIPLTPKNLSKPLDFEIFRENKSKLLSEMVKLVQTYLVSGDDTWLRHMSFKVWFNIFLLSPLVVKYERQIKLRGTSLTDPSLTDKTSSVSDQVIFEKPRFFNFAS